MEEKHGENLRAQPLSLSGPCLRGLSQRNNPVQMEGFNLFIGVSNPEPDWTRIGNLDPEPGTGRQIWP
jgi:hypothetical protein